MYSSTLYLLSVLVCQRTSYRILSPLEHAELTPVVLAVQGWAEKFLKNFAYHA